MTALAIALRGGAFALQVLLAVLLLRDARGNPVARYAGLYAIGAAASDIVWAPPFPLDPALWLLPFRVLAFGNFAVFWLLASAMFDDDFRPSWVNPAAWLGLVVLGFGCLYGLAGPPYLALNALSLVLVFLALWQVFAGRATDLDEGRRRLRVIFVLSVGLFIIAITVSAVLLQGGARYPWYGLADPLGSLLLTFFFAAMVLSVARASPLLSLALGAPAPAPPAPPIETPAAAEVEGGDAPLLASLHALMERDKAYREEGLGIAGLARKLELPEYRLRRLINQRLGYRNFSAFLNSHRIADAMAALADPSQAEVPILTIALDAGFQSIGPFNRAFKAQAGMTPTEFRRSRLGAAGGNVAA
jgi:AraC-like DNA-binding protein